MKTKTFRKKLALNKKTIADLTIGKMMNVQGGADTTNPRVLTFDPLICTEFVECLTSRYTLASGNPECANCYCQY